MMEVDELTTYGTISKNSSASRHVRNAAFQLELLQAYNEPFQAYLLEFCKILV